VLVGVVTFLAFLPALDGGFLDWDDDRNFLDNPNYRGLGWRQLGWMLTTTWMGHYIPLTWASLGLNYVLGGMRPWGYHLGNLVLHAANAAVLFLLARRLLLVAFRGRPEAAIHSPRAGSAGDGAIAAGAVVAALVFGLHPLRVESVAWITERRDVLCGLFYLLSVLAYVRGTESADLVSGRWRVLSLMAFTAVLGAKAIAVTLPLSLLILDAYPLRRFHLGWRSLCLEKAPYAVLSVAGGATAVWAVGHGAAWTPYESYGPGARIVMTLYGLWFYPRKLLSPDRLSPLYELPPRVDLSGGPFLAAALVGAGVTIALILLRRRLPGLSAAWAHSALVVLPVGGVLHAGHQLAHDRYSYLSGLGFALVAGGGATWVARERQRLSRWVFATVVAGVMASLLGLAAGSWQQTKIWRDSDTLWRAAVDADPACALCAAKLGHALMARGVLAEAEAELRRAVALRPERASAHNSLGTLLAQDERSPEAEQEFIEALRLAPRLADAAANLGALYAREGRMEEGIRLLREGLAGAPWLAHARTNLAHALSNHAITLAREGRGEEAVERFREATQLVSDDADLWRNLGQALVEQGQAASAIAALERAVALRPRGAPERFWLAKAYALGTRPEDAARQVEALRELDPAAAAELIRSGALPSR